MGSFNRVTRTDLKGQTNRLLGFPEEARLLIINADDFGMCHAVNEAIIRALQYGIVQSTTLMVPCAWAIQAMRFLVENPHIAFGVHLTAISDGDDYRWGPLLPRADVPTLVDEAGYFYNFEQMPAFLAQVNLAELELEFRAQIERVLAAGLQPTHLDWHSLRLNGRTDILAIMLKLAQEYGLALRVMGQSWIQTVQSHTLPTIDFDFLDSYLLEPATKMARFVELLHQLPPGLSEWAVHPGLDNAELQAIEPGGSHFRQADFDFFTSPQAQKTITQEGIVLLNYRSLQAVWRKS